MHISYRTPSCASRDRISSALPYPDLRCLDSLRLSVSFGIPAGWEATPNELADGRRLVLASDPSNSDTNIFIAFTPIRPDYSSLGSFGNIDYVASTVIPSCGQNGACRFANGDAIEGRMIASSVRKGNYVYDYTIEQKNGPTSRATTLEPPARAPGPTACNPDVPPPDCCDPSLICEHGPLSVLPSRRRHLLSLFTVQADAGASILVSLTAQCLDSNYAELAPTFNAVIESYKP